MLAAAVLITVAAGTRPSFDAYGWLDWGWMTLHGGLDTNAAPSFKPLPYVFTLVYGLFGRGPQLWLWMVTATAVSLGGVVCAGRLAARLTEGRDGSAGEARTGRVRAARWIAGLLAAAALLAVHDDYSFGGYLHYVLSAQSDPMIVACLLGAVDCQLHDRPRAAFGLLVLASLGRPEAWPLLALDGLWLWRARPRSRWAVLAGAAAVALLWFGVPALTSRSWLVAADNASASGYGVTGDAAQRAVGVLGRFAVQVPWPLLVAAAGAVGLALWRRERLGLALALGVAGWLVVEIAFGIHGWPALGRYMFEASAVVIVLAAGLVGRLVAGGPFAAGARGRGPGRRAGLAAGGLALVLIVASVPALVDGARRESTDLGAQRVRTAALIALARTVARLGDRRLRGCGEVISDGPGRTHLGLGTQTALAFDVGENVNRVGYRFPQPGHPDNPIVVFSPRGRAWSVRAERQRAPECRSLR